MKARIKATGEIVDVCSVEGFVGREQMYKENEWTNMCYPESNLDFEDTIDWEQRRYEIAKEVLADCMNYPGDERAATTAVKMADALIKQLKGE